MRAFHARSLNSCTYSSAALQRAARHDGDIPLLTYTSSFRMLQEAKWFQPVLASAHVAMETNSTHALLAAACAGLGIAVLPSFVARSAPDLLQVSDPVAAHDVWLVTHPEFRRDPKMCATADFLKRVAGGAEGLC